MNEKNLYTFTAILLAVLAAGHIVASRQFHMVWGVEADDATVFMSVRWAAMTLGYGCVLWQTRQRSEMYSTMNMTTALVSSLHGIYAVLAILNGTLTPFAWGPAIIELGLALAFGYLALRRRS